MIKLETLKPFVFSLAIVLIFFLTVIIYFQPMLDGKVLGQHDVVQYIGMSKELNDYRDNTGEEALWTNRMFSGMPGYLISVTYDNLISVVHSVFNLDKDHPQMLAFMYFLCFFIALLLLKIPIWLSMLGAFFYGFSSYFFIIIEAGHITKAIALSYMPVIIAAVVATYRGKVLLGASIFSLFLGLQIMINHLQITYYTMFILLFFFGFYVYECVKEKKLQSLIKPSLVLIAGVILAIMTNFGALYMTYDHGKDTMRGAPELSHNVEEQTRGLDKSYATSYSYGITETFNLLIPNYVGGASQTKLDDNSNLFKTLVQNGVSAHEARNIISHAPTYWGAQPFTSGPVYIGAIVVFLFVFGLFIIQGSVKWWLLSATIFSIMIAWGSNFMLLVDPMLDYFPGFNKFRTISMILVIPQFTMPLLAVLALHRFFTEQDAEQKSLMFKKLLYSVYVVGGLILMLLLFDGMRSYTGSVDAQLKNAWPDWLIDALHADRKQLFVSDAWRSLGIIALSFGVLAAVRFQKLRYMPAVLVLTAICFIDLWPVNKRYLNDDNFVTPRQVQNNYFALSEADKIIKQDPDMYYRVMNMANPFNDAVTSYHHFSIGGYHGAKLQRYQDMIDFHLSRMNMDVYNMLNTKYFIIQDRESGRKFPQKNHEALGNAWFVDSVRFVPNPDAEIDALYSFNPAQTAIVDERFRDMISQKEYIQDSAAVIKLTSYAPNHLQYEVHTAEHALAVFSEIYYAKGWNAYLNGEHVPHIRVNYILRAMEIPAGTHTIDFKFEPRMYYIGNRVSFISSLILIICVLGAIVWEVRRVILSENQKKE